MYEHKCGMESRLVMRCGYGTVRCGDWRSGEARGAGDRLEVACDIVMALGGKKKRNIKTKGMRSRDSLWERPKKVAKRTGMRLRGLV